MEKGKITLRTVAEKVGVSPSTISYVLNGKGSKVGISSATQRNIVEVAQNLGYSPHAGARMLKMQRSHTIAMIIRRGRYGLANAVLSKMVDAAEKALSAFDYNLFINQVEVASDVEHNAEFDILDLPKPVRESAVDGIIFLSVTPGKLEREIQRCLAGRPCVQVLGTDTDFAPNFTYRSEFAGRLVARYLCQLGHRDIAYLCGPVRGKQAKATSNGFLDECKILGLNKLIEKEVNDFEVEPGYRCGMGLLKNTKKGELTAIFCGNDMIAFGVLQAAHKLGWRVPEELAVIGMDNVVACEWTSPSLTTLEIPHNDLMRQAIEYLIRTIKNEHPLPVDLPSVSIIKRDSVLPRNKMSV